jgi:hypothetical protein
MVARKVCQNICVNQIGHVRLELHIEMMIVVITNTSRFNTIEYCYKIRVRLTEISSIDCCKSIIIVVSNTMDKDKKDKKHKVKIAEAASAFFAACETGKGWDKCKGTRCSPKLCGRTNEVLKFVDF